MATTKESMKVIAGGLDKKEKPEVVMEGKVIAVEVPDELAEAFEGLIGSMISKCENEDIQAPERDQNNGRESEDDDWKPTETQELASDIVFEVAERTGERFIRLIGGNDPEVVMGRITQMRSPKNNYHFY